MTKIRTYVKLAAALAGAVMLWAWGGAWCSSRRTTPNVCDIDKGCCAKYFQGV